MKINTFKGIENLVSQRDLGTSTRLEGAPLHDAIDVDISNSGGILGRKGYQLSESISIQNAYTTLSGDTYIISSGVLYRVEPDLSLVRIAFSTATEFCDFSKTLFTNDGVSVMQDTVINISVPTPSNGPEIVITGGGKPPGLYNVVYTYTNSNGLEGGASQVVTVELVSQGDILVTPLMIPGHTVNVYMTEAGGEVFYDVVYGNQLPPVCTNSAQLPNNSDKIEYFNSRLFISERLGDYTVIWYSKSYHYHLYNFDKDYIVVPGKVEVMRATEQAMLIGTAKEIYAYTPDGGLDKVANYGVIPGRSVAKLPTGGLLVYTQRGVCSAFPFTPITEPKLSLPMGTSCSTALVYNSGIQRFLALHDAGIPAFNSFS